MSLLPQLHVTAVILQRSKLTLTLQTSSGSEAVAGSLTVPLSSVFGLLQLLREISVSLAAECCALFSSCSPTASVGLSGAGQESSLSAFRKTKLAEITKCTEIQHGGRSRPRPSGLKFLRSVRREAPPSRRDRETTPREAAVFTASISPDESGLQRKLFEKRR
ncbi:hypothetical protein EYF80_021646 [Liparis tanakae]|uniref:Uncharacterized protein n=1 Tax=Liparis tanakae TaxID=230148 RepID=A0A4Z2HT73_9TELE|nr:hypothetical protein EYF80_021646 [Liparis tanakae]